MQTHVESLGALERRVALSLAAAEIQSEVNTRLNDMARKVRMPGFRPGKVPLKMVAANYGAQIQAEVLNDKVGAAFTQAVKDSGLRVAGTPRVEAQAGTDAGQLAFSATFEIYPEIKLGDLSAVEVQQARCAVGEAQLERTIDIMRRQRATWAAAGRPAEDGDRLTVDFVGSIDGAAFQGGSATDFVFPLGEGRMLPEFEQAARGMAAGQQKTFAVTFPPDYRANDLAGKAAQFTLTLKAVEAPTLPAVDAAFAKTLGVPDGDVARMQGDIRANLEREVARRLRTRTRESAMEALLKVTSFDLPRALVDAEATRLAESARADLVTRGVQAKDAPLPTEVFTPQAERRVRLGLILAEIVRTEGLQARQDQIRKSIEEVAQSYEKPAEVIQWYLSNRERVAEIETVVIEDNVVNWTMAKAKVVDVTVPFDELMGRTG